VPADFPPWRTVYGLFQRWHARGVTIALHDALRAAARQAAGRAVEPTAAVIGSSFAVIALDFSISAAALFVTGGDL